MSSSGDKLSAEVVDPKEKRKSLRLTSEKRENSAGKEKKEKEKHKEHKDKDKEHKDKDKLPKEKDKKDKSSKDKKDKSSKEEKDKDKRGSASPSGARPAVPSNVSSATLTSKDRRGFDGKDKKSSSSSRVLKLGRKRSTKTEPMPEPAKLLEIWNQLLVRAPIHSNLFPSIPFWRRGLPQKPAN